MTKTDESTSEHSIFHHLTNFWDKIFGQKSNQKILDICRFFAGYCGDMWVKKLIELALAACRIFAHLGGVDFLLKSSLLYI